MIFMKKLKKIIRFSLIYGPVRTWFKLAGRARVKLGMFRPWVRRRNLDVGVIGCGQFAFSTIGYSLSKHYGSRFVDCYDIDSLAQASFANFYRIKSHTRSASKLINNDLVRYVYVASNHASHAEYAVDALDAGKVVYIEKPIAVTRAQLNKLSKSVMRSKKPIYVGYNRPFSPAVTKLRGLVKNQSGPVTLNCFISGHYIEPDHWYRDPNEGTRICGNVGHWLDLAIHILNWDKLADRWQVTIGYSDLTVRDDNNSITLASDRGDLIVIVLTARSEPFEGINETINFQQQDTICKIDDFRKMKVWQASKILKYRFWPKDVGHKNALLQPFVNKSYRDWSEIEKSTLLMLHIADMVKTGKEISWFSFEDALESVR